MSCGTLGVGWTEGALGPARGAAPLIQGGAMKRRTLIDLIAHDLKKDPGDAPALILRDVIDLQDLGWMAETAEPIRPEPIPRVGSR